MVQMKCSTWGTLTKTKNFRTEKLNVKNFNYIVCTENILIYSNYTYKGIQNTTYNLFNNTY